MDELGSRRPLAVSPDVFCTPAVQKYEGSRGAERHGEGGRPDPLSNSKKFGLERAGQSSPRGGSILAVRDPNVRRMGTQSGSVKRVSFKDVTVTSPAAAEVPEGGLGEDQLGLRHRQGQNASGENVMPSPGPWTQLIDGMGPEESFTHYVNPLASGEDDREAESLEPLAEQHTPVSQLSRAVDTATSRGVAFHMQTPEAVQVLHKISLRTKGKLDRSSLDHFLRTGPKKLSPEPGFVLLDGLVDGETQADRLGDSTRASQKVDGRVCLESSEDENAVDEVDEVAEAPHQEHKLIVASPIGRNCEDGTGLSVTDLDEVPPTFQLGHSFKTIGRVTSPVRFNLLGDSPDSFGAKQSIDEERESNGNEKSFSFGMGGDDGHGAAVDEAEVTAQLLDACKDMDEDDQDESVDQPNPFGAMLGKLRADPMQLQSPVLGAIKKDAMSEGSPAGSPESPANCTPLNLISTSSATSLQTAEDRGASKAQENANAQVADRNNGLRNDGNGDEVSDILSNASSLDEWMKMRGIEHISTPTRSDLQKMWDALDNIRDTTGAYADALRENARLHEELWETREAELDARADLEEALEVVRIEQERSRNAAERMAELAMSMHQQFSMLEDERRQLQSDLDQARQMLESSVDEGVANVMQEIDGLKAELERLRIAEQAARTDAMNARAEAKALRNKVLLLEDSTGSKASPAMDGAEVDDEPVDTVDEASLGNAGEVIHVAGVPDEGATDDAEATYAAFDVEFHHHESTAMTGVQDKVEFFERLQLDARCGINEPAEPTDPSGCSAMSPYGDSILPECPHTGIRAPRTTPVDADDTTTPYRIHIETMNQFRDTWQEAGDADIDGTEESHPDEIESSGSEGSGSDLSDYEVEDIVVSPIDVEDLTRANLRQTVMQRIAAVKSDLASAKSRLGQAQSGFRGHKGSKGHVTTPKTAPVALDVIAEQETNGCDVENTPVADPPNAVDREDEILHALDDQVDDEANGYDDADGENAEAEQDVPAPVSQSHRSIFARRLDATSTPLSIRKAVFTPKTTMSSLKSTAHMSPRFSSTASSLTPLPPSYLQQPIASRPSQRTRRFGLAREPSAEEDREFRRRAAALNIHVSPYMKRSARRQMALN